MSWQALNWATKVRVGRASAKHVLMVLANYADENGTCFPSQAMLAADTEMSKRAVQDQLDFLEAHRLLSREQCRRGRRQGRNRYHLAIDGQPACAAGNQEARKPEGLTGTDQGAGADPETIEDRQVANPAPSDADAVRTQMTTPQVANDDASGGKSCTPYKEEPPDEPPEEPPVEREARARASIPVDRFKRIWPTASTDSHKRIKDAWDALDDAERQAALDGVPRFLDALKANGRSGKGVPSGGVYLAERRWENLPEPEPERAKPVAAKAFSQAWWWWWWSVLLSGDVRKARNWLGEARMRFTGPAFRPGEEPTKADLAAMAKCRTDSDVFDRWRRHASRLGIDLDIWDEPRWLWVPGGEPPGDPPETRGAEGPSPDRDARDAAQRAADELADF